MSSDNEIPYLNYRTAEIAFCKAFRSKDVSRSDVAVDAVKDDVGIGIKTFLQKNNKTFQKVAEFNATRELYSNLSKVRLIKKIVELRNRRLQVAKDLFDLKSLIYHCVIRDAFSFSIYEEPMEEIQVNKISNIETKGNMRYFSDGLHDYSFNLSKSTLNKRFVTDQCYVSFDVKIIEDPFSYLLKHDKEAKMRSKDSLQQIEKVYLPLYGRNRTVYPKSGLNQCFAGGRLRKPYEVYIPIPIWIHDKFGDFFPPRDQPFDLRIPSGNTLQAKTCQAGGKALMSNPNKSLGEWILRKELGLKEGELVTMDHLKKKKIDSVLIEKLDENNFKISTQFNYAHEWD